MTTQKQISELPRNHATNLAHLGGLNNSSNALKSLALKGIYGTINSCNYQLKNMSKLPLSLASQNVAKAQELIESWYKQGHVISQTKEALSPAEAIQVQKNFDSAKEAMSRMAGRVYEKMLGSKRGEELLAKVKQYNIPYDKHFINWLELINLVDEYEALLLRADEYNIAWDLSEYDPVGLQQEIEYCVSAGRSETNDLHRYYFDSRL